MAPKQLLYLHDGIESWLQACQMFLLHLDALMDLLLCGQGLPVFFCQPVSKHKFLTVALWSQKKKKKSRLFFWPQHATNALCCVQVCLPLPLFKLPVQSCQCELVGIIFCDVRPGNVLWRLLVKRFLRHQVYLLMLRPGPGKGMWTQHFLNIS